MEKQNEHPTTSKLYEISDSLTKRLWLFQCQEIDIAKSKKGHNYSYAPLDDIMSAIKPHLISCGIGIAHSISCEEKSQSVATIENKKERSYLITKLFNVDDGADDFNQCKSLIDEDIKLASMNPLMVLGASLTYLRRYHVTTLLALTTEEDTDASSNSKGESSTVKKGNTVDYIAVFTKQLSANKTVEQITKILEFTYKTSWSFILDINYSKDWENLSIQILCFRLTINFI